MYNVIRVMKDVWKMFDMFLLSLKLGPKALENTF